MKIAVLMKPVLDCGVSLLINDKEMRVVQKDQSPAWIVNPADRAALETAVRIKKENEGVEVVAVSFASSNNPNAIYHALARDADRGVLIEDNAGTIRDASFVAEALARYLAREKPELVLCGTVTIDHGMGCVGPFIAEHLNVPQVIGAVELQIAPEKMKITVQRRLDMGNREKVECPLPAVVSIDPMTSNPKYVSVCALSLASKRVIERIELDCLEMSNRNHVLTRLLKLEPPRPRPKRTFIPNSKLSPGERLKLIASGGMMEKKEVKTLTGTPESIAEGIFTFLREKGFLE